jgi:Putative zinc-finger
MNNELKNCGKKELLMAFLYNEVSAAERKEFENHQSNCADCRFELNSFKHTRAEMSSWQIPFTPNIQVTIPRTAMDALREFFTLVPTWFKVGSGLAAATAAALLFLAIANLNSKNSTPNQLASVTPPVVNQKAEVLPAQNVFTREEAEKMIQAAVAKSQLQAQQETRQQLVNLETKLSSAHQSDLKNATLKLKKQQQKTLDALVAESQKQTVAEWLFAATDTGGDDEKNN